MSLQLAIPRRVALQQSSLPLHQPSVILKEKRKIENPKSLNCTCANSKLSQQRGSPQIRVPKSVPAHAGDADLLEGRLDLLLQHRSQVERFAALQSFRREDEIARLVVET